MNRINYFSFSLVLGKFGVYSKIRFKDIFKISSSVTRVNKLQVYEMKNSLYFILLDFSIKHEIMN